MKLAMYTATYCVVGTQNGSNMITSKSHQRNKTLCDILQWNMDVTQKNAHMDTWFVLPSRDKLLYVVNKAVEGTSVEHKIDAEAAITPYIELVTLRYMTLAILLIDSVTQKRVEADTPRWFSKYMEGLQKRWDVAVCGQFKYAKKAHYCAREASSPERFTSDEIGIVALLHMGSVQ